MQELEQETILGDLSGFEFEDLMMEVFKKLGFENVRNPGFTGDEGRDIIMERSRDDQKIVYIVECKNVSSKIGRPVVQKLHSAVNTFETDHKKKGIIVTTSTFTPQAKNYIKKIQEDKVDLWDGNKLRDIADEIGLDLYNGEIEVLCKESLPLPENREVLEKRLIKELENVHNFNRNLLDNLKLRLTLYPVLYVDYKVNSSLETTIGTINEVDISDYKILRADDIIKEDRTDTEISKVVENSKRKKKLSKQDLIAQIDSMEKIRFEKTETQFKKEIKQQIIQENTEEVVYTGKNNVTYNKTHEPKEKEIQLSKVEPLYVPEVEVIAEIKDHNHRIQFYKTQENEIIRENEIVKDTHTKKKPWIFNLTVCSYCGSLNNRRNIKTEKLSKEPICRHCATTKRFMLNKKYFKDDESLENFEEEYKNRKLKYKLLENKSGLIASISIGLISIVFSTGLI